MNEEVEHEIDELLASGQPALAAARAEAALDDHRDREALWARWMIALARDGRSVEALRAFQQLKRELGRDPSDWLVALERAIALHDLAVLDVGATAEFIPGRQATRPRLRSDQPLPQGVITFFMTDVVGSTRLWETVPRTMRQALARHDELVADAVEAHDGIVVRERGEGDSTFSVFRRATDAAAAALTVQTYLEDELWPPDCRISIRSALHTGEASDRDGDYYGRVVNRTARLRAIAEPGQILVSQSSAEVIIDHLPAGCLLVSLGTQLLKDMERPERVYLLVASDTEPSPTQPVERIDRGSRARWEVVVGADREYFESNGHEGSGVPDWDFCHPASVGRASMSIGRPSRSAGLVPDIDVAALTGDTSVSRAHAVLEWAEDGSLAVVDLDSTNGTYVNDIDEPIPPNEPRSLADGDAIYLGAWTRLDVRRVDT